MEEKYAGIVLVVTGIVLIAGTEITIYEKILIGCEHKFLYEFY